VAFPPDIAFHYLEKAWREKRLAHAILVSGLGSDDRRQFAERVVRRINSPNAATLETMAAEGVFLIEPESKSRQITIEQIRSLEHVLNLKAPAGKSKIGIVVEADRMNQASTNAFLKTLEEPPDASLLLLLTGAPGQLLDTVVSRCLRLPLFKPSGSATRQPTEIESRLLDALAAHFAAPPTPARALGLLGVYSGLLAELKEEITDAHETQQKLETAHYEKTTDASKWLREREHYYDALSSAHYLHARARLLEVLLLWFGDLLRRQAGHMHPEFPDHIGALDAAANRLTIDDLLVRLRSLEDLGRYYETNVNEALATELAFLGAFG
jgi:DNA polymerase-3 subunit delta'